MLKEKLSQGYTINKIYSKIEMSAETLAYIVYLEEETEPFYVDEEEESEIKL
jgi:hypothetical protein